VRARAARACWLPLRQGLRRRRQDRERESGKDDERFHHLSPFAAFASILRACARDHQSGGIAWWPPATLGFALMLALSDTALAYIADRRHGIAAERARTVT